MTFGPPKQDIANENCKKQVVLTTFHFQPAFQTVARARHPRGAVTMFYWVKQHIFMLKQLNIVQQCQTCFYWIKHG